MFNVTKGTIDTNANKIEVISPIKAKLKVIYVHLNGIKASTQYFGERYLKKAGCRMSEIF